MPWFNDWLLPIINGHGMNCSLFLLIMMIETTAYAMESTNQRAARSQNEDKICVICRESVSGPRIITACRHEFCMTCLLHWAQRGHNTCPTCRRELVKEGFEDLFGLIVHDHDTDDIPDEIACSTVCIQVVAACSLCLAGAAIFFIPLHIIKG